MLYPKDKKLMQSEFRQIKKYSLHCAQWQLFKGARLRIAMRYARKCEKLKLQHKNRKLKLTQVNEKLKKEKKRAQMLDHCQKFICQNKQEIRDLKSDLRNALEEKRLLECSQSGTIIPEREKDLMHDNVKLVVEVSKLKEEAKLQKS